MIINDRLKSFCRKYLVNVISDYKRCVKYTAPRYTYNPEDDGKISNILRDTEPLLTVEIPLSRLEALVDLENIFYNNITDDSKRAYFQVWMQRQEQEAQLRQKYPTIQAAYEQYCMTLNLCGGKPNEIKDLK